MICRGRVNRVMAAPEPATLTVLAAGVVLARRGIAGLSGPAGALLERAIADENQMAP